MSIINFLVYSSAINLTCGINTYFLNHHLLFEGISELNRFSGSKQYSALYCYVIFLYKLLWLVSHKCQFLKIQTKYFSFFDVNRDWIV